MVIKSSLPVVAGAVVLAALSPTAASAQSFGIYVGPAYPTYAYPGRGYDVPRYDEDRAAWAAHERWEQRRAWDRERWEGIEARRRYWQHERWEDRREWHDDEDD